MFSHNNKKCICCGHEYRYCNNCQEFDKFPTWMAIFHNSNCKEIYNATSMYGQIPNEEIKARLDKCDLSNKENFHKNIRKVIDEVYTIEPVATIVAEEVAVVEEVTVEPKVVAEEINDEFEFVTDTAELSAVISEDMVGYVVTPAETTYNYKKKKKK